MKWEPESGKQCIYAMLCGLFLFTTGCGNSEDDKSEADVTERPDLEWQASYERLQKCKRDRITELAKTSPTYPRPAHDLGLVPTSYEGRIAVMNTTNGDILAGQTSDRESKTLVYAFRLSTGELISFYHVQLVSGYPDKIDFVPYRIFNITHNISPSSEALKARSRMSPEIFARYLASSADYVDDPAKKFVVIYAPLEADEALV